jgi:iron complex outermembrane receptor protein
MDFVTPAGTEKIRTVTFLPSGINIAGCGLDPGVVLYRPPPLGGGRCHSKTPNAYPMTPHFYVSHAIGHFPSACIAVFSLLIITPSPGFSQSTSTADGARKQTETVIHLAPFEVSTTIDTGYVASSVVSGTRFNVPIKEIPLGIQVHTEEFIRDLGAVEVDDLIGYSANVYPQGRGDTSPGFNVRGFNTSFALRNGFRTNAVMGAANIERVEIVKGPQSVLFGQMNPGGVINVITKRPQWQPRHNFSLAVGELSFRQARMDLTGPLGTERKLAYRTIVEHHHHRYDDTFARMERNHLTQSLLLQPLDRVRILVEYDLQRRNTVPQDDTPIGNVTDAAGNVLRVPATMEVPGFGTIVPKGAGTILTYLDKSMGRSFSLRGPDAFANFENRNLYIDATLQLTQALTFRANANRRTLLYERNALHSGAFILKPEFWNSFRWEYFDRTVHDETVRTELFGDFEPAQGVRLRAIAGWEYSEGDYRNIERRRTVGAPAPFGTIPDARTIPFTRFRDNSSLYTNLASEQISKSENDAIYAILQGSALGERVHFLAGLRRDSVKEWTSRISRGFTAEPTLTDRANTNNLGFVYAINPAVSLFVGRSTAFVPNGSGTDRSNNPIALPPQVGEGYEGGLKFTALEQRLSGTASFFRNDRTNIRRQVSIFDQTGAQTGFETTVSGLERAEGVDFDLVWSPTRSWQIVLAGSYTDGEVLSDDEAPENIGRIPPELSKYQAAVWTRYRFSEGPWAGFAIGGGFNYSEGTVLEAQNDRRPRVSDDMGLFDFFASYAFKTFGRDSSVALNVSNVFNKEGLQRDKRFNAARQIRTTYNIRF